MRTPLLLCFLTSTLSHLGQAQTPFIWSGGAGNWSDTAKWSTGSVPDSPSADILIDNGSAAGSVVTLNPGAGGGHVEIGRLRIDADDTLAFGANQRLISNDSGFAGAGVWTINGTLSLPLADNYLEGPKTFSGSGKIVFGAAPGAGNISNVYDDTTNNITIEGTARFGGYNTSKPRLVNNGLFHANVAGAAMELRGRDVLNAATTDDNINAGTLKSTNGATLFMGEGDWQNSAGQIFADGAGSILMFGERARIFGGAISAMNGGLIRIASGGANSWKDVTVNGPTEINLGTIPFEGTVTNNGTMTVSGSGQIYSHNVPHDPIVIAGTGQIVLDKPDINTAPAFDDAYGKWLIQGQLIRGRGRVGSWSGGFGGMEIQIDNRGTFQADRNGEWLHIDVERFDNQAGGTVRAQDGGLLFLTSRVALQNTGGTIEALSGGRIEAGFARIEGGLVRNFGGTVLLKGMQLYNPGSGMRLEGDLTLGGAGSSHEASIINGIENTGILRVRSFGQDARLRIGEPANPSATLTGGGQIILGDASSNFGANYIYETSNTGNTLVPLNNVDNTIRGFGTIGDSNIFRLSLNNSSLVKADVAEKMLLLRLIAADNTNGVFRAENGGHLRLEAIQGVANVGGLFEAEAGSTIDLHWSTTFTGGTLRNDGGSFNLGYAILVNPGSGLTLQGPMHISNGLTTRLVGDITNEGSIQSRSTGSDTKLYIGRDGAPDVHMIGGGELIVNDLAAGSDKGRIEEGTSGANLFIDNQLLRGFGWVGWSRGLNLINNDRLQADVNGRFLGLYVNTLLNSPGKVMKGTNGGNLHLDFITLTNTGASILAESGSQVTIDGDQSRRLIGGLVRTEIGGTLNLQQGLKAEGGVAFQNLGTATVGSTTGGERKLLGLDDGGSQFLNAGTLRKINSPEYHLHSPLTHTGSIITEAGVLRMFGGGTVTNASIATSANSHTGFHGLQSYTFGGVNTFTGPGNHFVADGTLILSDAATQINASNFNFNGGSTLSGPGTLTAAGELRFDGYSNSTISGAKVIQLQNGSGVMRGEGKVSLTNSARLENQGTFTFEAGNRIDGTAGTLFSNLSSGVLRTFWDPKFYAPFYNSGLIQVLHRNLSIYGPTTFDDGEISVVAGADAGFRNMTLTLQGAENVISGDGITYFENAPVVFGAGAAITATKVDFHGATSLAGPGDFTVTKDLRFFHSFAPESVISGINLRVTEGATGRFEYGSSNTRFQNGSVFENNGTFEVSGNPSFTTDGTAEWRIGPTGRTNFNIITTVPYKLLLQGTVAVANADGRSVTFNGGGVLESGADVINGPLTTVVFSGAQPWLARGQGIEFIGGTVKFLDTNFQLEDLTPADPSDDITISSSARVVLHGAANVSGRGELAASSFAFVDGNYIVDATTLKATGAPLDSQWVSPNGTLEFKNGARFINQGRFSIQAKVGTLLNDPGIKGEMGTLFHNATTGRVIHDTPTTTEFGIDFQNDGVLEFAKGTVNFLQRFSGNGGIAASNGAKVNLSLAGVPNDQIPSLFETIGAGSEINVALASGQILSLNINLNGGKIVAAGGLNMVAAGGLNMVAAGGGNIVAAGGLNMVAAGGGNITATGAASLIQANNMVAAGAGNILSHNGGQMVAAGGLNAEGSVTADGGLIRTEGSAGIVAAGAGNVLSHNGGQIVAAGAGNILSHNGGQIVAAGGGNIVAAGGGDIVAAGAGNRPAIRAEGIAPVEVALFGGGTITVETDGKARAENGGQIVAESGGVLRGAGTFEGPGFVQSGGTLSPGISVGILTWTGNLDVQSGGMLEIEIGGTTAGTQHDRVNVSGIFTMNGSLGVRMLNGFGSNVQPTDVFDIVTAGSPITTALAGSRVNAAGSYGTFEVQLVNGGNTLRLANYQPGAVTYSNWATRYGLTGANAEMMADPNHNGLANLLEYALGLDPTIGGSTGITTGTMEENGQKYLTLSYTKPTGAEAPTDIIYAPERASTLVLPNWSSSVVDIVAVGTVPGPGNLETVTVRSTHPISAAPREFMRLRVTRQ